jgi:hypothetical protein
MPSDDSKIQLPHGVIEDAERAMQLAIDVGLYARLDAEQIRAIREPWTAALCAYSPPGQTTRCPRSSPPRSNTLGTTAIPYAWTRCSLE